MLTQLVIVWKGMSKADVPHWISYKPSYNLEMLEFDSGARGKGTDSHVEISVIPFPIRTLWRLITVRPSSLAITFWSYISLANTGM